ncbi:MAG: DNA mismatch repair protein MutS [Fuerstiella sp.]|jgi:DNA mismatch repair protein MutS|nr:DNA mismatch repair protein MutS [Fuerstiella sp.]MCP4511993.1 DNA mismatch repair protein MutS [Fuerstiella sp.]MDG2129690.1 DNA mismatch repair protein MutS [Fuerstiella sp.]
MTAKLSPMMERYREVKAENPGAILLFRMGDFYELFYEDAQNAARVLGLTLTSRDKSSENPIPMAGFPYHQLDNYLQKLIQSGFRAAICDQVEDPRKAKGLVRREVTRVITPGTLTDDQLLDPRISNFIACVAPAKSSIGLAWLELSTGRFLVSEIEPALLQDELARISPAECLVPEESVNDGDLPVARVDLGGPVLTGRPAWCFSKDESRRLLHEHFGTKTLEGFDVEDHSPAVTAAGALLEYIRDTQKSALLHITRLESYRRQRHMVIDEATRRSLELTQTIRDGRREQTLLGVIDETCTPMGARLLADWLSSPLTDIGQIGQRLDAVEEMVSNLTLRDDLRELLKGIYDLQRLTSRVATGRCSPRDLSCLASTLGQLPKLRAKLAERSAKRLRTLEERVDLCPEVRQAISEAITDEPPISVADGGIVRPGFNAKLDDLRDLSKGGKQWIASYQAQESERTGIPNLKIGFNKVFGYYLEVTGAHLSKVPEDYIRKQTLKNQERYITPELKEYEDKVLRAEDQSKALEHEIFSKLKEDVAEHVVRLLSTAEALAEIDVLVGLGTLAAAAGYCRPEITEDPVLDIREGRHPVLDRLMSAGEFVPNDVRLGVECDSTEQGSDSSDQTQQDMSQSCAAINPNGRVQLITGPNMAGKSTYIRQAALITVMAQMGSFVPASEARIGIADRVFARVGASDELGKGQSTFMVEMTETARILNSASERSVVILDEIGRGTSTYDGISLAWSITEHLHDETQCRTMFATHYHELTDLSQTLKHASNWHVAVQENNDDVIFLHRVVEGAAGRSYGIHVAKLAGVPRSVTQRAATILESLESQHVNDDGRPALPRRETTRQTQQQLSLFELPEDPLLDEIRNMQVDDMTPRMAMDELYRLRQELSARKT